MSEAREIAKKFATAVEEQRFLDAFNLISETGTYTVIGTTKASGTYHGRSDVLNRLVAILAGFVVPPQVKFAHIVVDQNRAVLIGAGQGVGPTGPYEQPNYAFSLRVGNGEIEEIVEFLDTTMLDTAVFGKKIVNR